MRAIQCMMRYPIVFSGSSRYRITSFVPIAVETNGGLYDDISIPRENYSDYRL